MSHLVLCCLAGTSWVKRSPESGFTSKEIKNVREKWKGKGSVLRVGQWNPHDWNQQTPSRFCSSPASSHGSILVHSTNWSAMLRILGPSEGPMGDGALRDQQCLPWVWESRVRCESVLP